MVLDETAVKESTARAIDVCRRIEMMCNFFENPTIKKAIEDAIPVCMPPFVASLGFDILFGLASV
jgi:hypothetical protein